MTTSSFPCILSPPFRFSAVEDGVYRGGHPTLKNFRFLRRLRLKSIVSLTTDEPRLDLVEFCMHEGIRNFHYEVNNDKEKVALRTQVVVDVLQLIIDPTNLPLYIHCSNGVRATGIAIMCLRKLQGWNLAALFSEFCRFTREGEISRQETQFVESFQAEIVIPPSPPYWLFHRQRAHHPDFKLLFAPAPGTAEPVATENPAKLRSALIKQELTTVRSAPSAPRADARLLSLSLQALCLETVTTPPTPPKQRRFRVMDV